MGSLSLPCSLLFLLLISMCCADTIDSQMFHIGRHYMVHNTSNEDTIILQQGNLRIGSGGINDRMIIKTNGNVGIGTTNPAGRLAVKGFESEASTLFETLLLFEVSDGSFASMYRDHNGADNYFGLECFNVGNTVKTPIVFQEFGGTVGIGTSVPTEILHVKGINAGDGALIGNVKIGIWEGGVGTATFTNDAIHSTSTAYALGQADDGTTYLNTAAGKFIGFNIGDINKMTLDLNGNLGIGTETPGEKLHVAGNAAKTVGGTTWLDLSDRRIKKDIRKLDGKESINIINKLKPVEYRYNKQHIDINSKNNKLHGKLKLPIVYMYDYCLVCVYV